MVFLLNALMDAHILAKGQNAIRSGVTAWRRYVATRRQSTVSSMDATAILSQFNLRRLLRLDSVQKPVEMKLQPAPTSTARITALARAPIVATKNLVTTTIQQTKKVNERVIGPVINFKIMTQPLYSEWAQSQLPPKGATLDRYRLVVSIVKRPLTDWEALQVIGVEHVGVQIHVLSPALLRIARSLPQPALPKHTFDFLPIKGDTSKFGGRVEAHVRHNQLAPRDWAVVGWSERRLTDILTFNRAFDTTYHLGHNDCRDYASSLIKFLTGQTVAPGMLSWFINTSQYRNLTNGAMLAHILQHSKLLPNYRPRDMALSGGGGGGKRETPLLIPLHTK
eukprot:TRINITY_DN15055_c0_g1_i1.p1 TRINITY_DN15055_c0_g1~~TRINITY_DN15055_c0_g1_i1.p1  ORF type:complete len:337 (-),score=63.87 TRINITY_DN15055_c0_g1_i1:528-1538(-)